MKTGNKNMFNERVCFFGWRNMTVNVFFFFFFYVYHLRYTTMLKHNTGIIVREGHEIETPSPVAQRQFACVDNTYILLLLMELYTTCRTYHSSNFFAHKYVCPKPKQYRRIAFNTTRQNICYVLTIPFPLL